MDIFRFHAYSQRTNSISLVPYVVAIIQIVVVFCNAEVLGFVTKAYNKSFFFTYLIKLVYEGILAIHDLVYDAPSVQFLVDGVGWGSLLHTKGRLEKI